MLVVFVLLAGFVNLVRVAGANHRDGGSATPAYVKDGHYYVCCDDAKQVREVSREVWTANYQRNRSLIPWIAAMYLAFGYILVFEAFPAFMFRAPPAKSAAVVAEVQASGPALLSRRMNGGWGEAHFYAIFGALRVSVHPGGVIVKAFFYPPVALRREEITDVYVKEWWLKDRTFVEHTSKLVARRVYFDDTSDAFLAASREIMQET